MRRVYGFVAVLDRRGKVVYRNRALHADLIGGDADRVLGRDAITIDLFSRLGKDKKIGFVALRRTDGSGTVIIALDRDGQRYWGIKVSVEKALERLGQGQGLVYIKIMDPLPVAAGMERLAGTPAKPADLGLPVNGTEELGRNMAGVEHEKGVIFDLQQRRVPAATLTPSRPSAHSQGHFPEKMPH